MSEQKQKIEALVRMKFVCESESVKDDDMGRPHKMLLWFAADLIWAKPREELAPGTTWGWFCPACVDFDEMHTTEETLANLLEQIAN